MDNTPKRKKWKPLTSVEHENIEAFLKSGRSIAYIARELGRHTLYIGK